jgi:glutathione peroxidase
MSSARIAAPLFTGALALSLGLLPLVARSGPQEGSRKEAKVPAALTFSMKDIDGNTVPLSRYQGQVVLMVNVASFCGNTPQYASLESLYEKYKGRGFTVLGFPSNDFGKQEPGSSTEIKEFCSTKYHITFPMFEKIVVKGEGQAPLYRYLTDKKLNPTTGGDIEWNFAKFLLNRKGEVVARFPAGTNPATPEVVQAIEKELAVPAGSVQAASKE